MEHVIEIRYCGLCMEKLYEYGCPAVAAFEMICEHLIIFQDSYKVIHPKELLPRPNLEFFEIKNVVEDSFLEIVNFLERKNFVTTTDVIDELYIDILPKGVQQVGKDYEFCLDESHYDGGDA